MINCLWCEIRFVAYHERLYGKVSRTKEMKRISKRLKGKADTIEAHKAVKSGLNFSLTLKFAACI